MKKPRPARFRSIYPKWFRDGQKPQNLIYHMNSAQLNEMHCSTPGCLCRDKEIFLVPRCHPEAGLEACYYKTVQRLYLNCARCKEFVCTVEVK